MKKNILLALLLSGLSFSSFAQASNEKVVELFQIMKSDKMMSGMMDNMMAIMGQQGGSLKNKADNKAFTEYMNYVTQEGKVMMKKIMNEDMVTLYSKYFTNEEIQYYIDFYATPAGKKMLEMTPAIQKEFMTSFMANDMPAFQSKLKTKLEELHNQYPASNPATAKK